MCCSAPTSLRDVQSVCDSLIVIDGGQILFAGTPEQLIRSASGHVGVFWEKEAPGDPEEQGLRITAASIQARGSGAGRWPMSFRLMQGRRSRPWRTPISILFPGGGSMKMLPLLSLELRRLLQSALTWLLAGLTASLRLWGWFSISRPPPKPCFPCILPILPSPGARRAAFCSGFCRSLSWIGPRAAGWRR